MKKTLLALAASSLLAASAVADEIKIGVLLGFTGPAESLAPDMASGAELAINEVSSSGALLNGSTVTGVRGDSTCIDAAAAVAVAERVITSIKLMVSWALYVQARQQLFFRMLP